MQETPRAAVVGAGPAGLAAALKLVQGGLSVLLIDREDRLGGTPVAFGCKATDRCASCFACLNLQQVRDARDAGAIEVITGGEVTGLTGAPKDRKLELGDRQESVAGVIVATGYQPAEIEQARPDYGLGQVAGVTTALELERRFRSGALADSPPRSLAFVQCAGSRDSSIGRDYCSRVCCTYALRLARAIQHRMPEVKLTVFYQDLTPAGPGFDELVAECQGVMNLTRGLPAKIYQEPGGSRPVVCRANVLSGDLAEVAFDEVALSVGIWAREDSRLEEIFGLERDEHGFYTASSQNRVLPAGSCRGPMSIGESFEDGRVAAAELLRRIDDRPRGKVAILGSDERLSALAEREGFEPVTASAIHGVAGAYLAETKDGEVPVEGGILAGLRADAEEAPLPPNVRSIYSKSGFDKAQNARRVAILLDFWAPYSRVAHQKALELAEARVGEKQRTWILCRHAFTGEPGLEALMTRVREAGTAIVHVTETPAIDAGVVTYMDPGLGQRQELRVDLIVGAPALGPTDEQRLDLEAHHLSGKSRHGVVHPRPLTLEDLEVPDNPHLGLSRSPRQGIHVSGWLRDPASSREAARRAEEAALADLATALSPGRAEVDPEYCAICLTCLRACPHSAPVMVYEEDLDKHVSYIQPEACVSCGLCVSLCPADAISHSDVSDASIEENLGELNVR
ncbi:MAG: NAD(P)-binding protein [Armatimonadia bacterium]|nr:NAD(P)-binding protein [Armatimonadia bacterium]